PYKGIEFFETRNKPVTLFVIYHLMHLEASLQLGIIKPSISQEIKSKFEYNYFKIESYVTIFYEVYQLAFNKFKKHIYQYSVLLLFKAI
ncbi:5612_t:CDS:1, partial [Scutellospora calospora]